MVLVRYYFHLTDDTEVIRDDEGVEAPDDRSAVTFAMAAVRELKAEGPSAASEWQGWRLEIIDSSGRPVTCIRLDACRVH